MTLPPNLIGDNAGHRYEIHAQDEDGFDLTLGWSEDSQAFLAAVEQHPSWDHRYVIDRQQKDRGLHVPLPPQALHPNARTTWQPKMRAKKKHRDAVGELAWGYIQDRYRHKPHFRQVAIRLRFILAAPTRGGKTPHDPDNLIAWAKTTIDALTDAGLLADDREVIHLPPGQTWADLPRLEIAVYPVSLDQCPLCRKPAE